MNINIFGKNIEVTPGIKSAVESKLSTLEKYLAEDTRVDVTLSVDKNDQKVEVTIPVRGHIIRAEEVSNDMYATIDLVEETIERQIRKYKNKMVDKKRATADVSIPEFVEFDYDDDEEEVKIVRTKRFGVKPMDPEEACIQMDLIGHNFFVFLNADTDEVNVVYKRKNGTYGLIEPEFD